MLDSFLPVQSCAVLWYKILYLQHLCVFILQHTICIDVRKPMNRAVLHIKLQLYIIAFIMLEGDVISTELHLII